MNLNKTTVRKLLQTVDAGLCSGVGEPIPGEMCVEAAVCYALDLPHGDGPECVGWAVRLFIINLNDCDWSSDKARAAGLRKLSVAQLGSNTLDQDRFVKLFALKTVQRLCPLLFEELARLVDDEGQESMNSMGRACAAVESLQDEVPVLVEALELTPARGPDFVRVITVTDAIDSTFNFALDLDYIDSNTRLISTSDALGNTFDLCITLAHALCLDLDKALAMLADVCLAVLVEMESPGCQWLELCESKTDE